MPSELAPGFLVAAPSLHDPNFSRAVVLLIDHRTEGSLGFVINRPATVSFKSVANELGLVPAGRPLPDVPVLIGGPVAPHTGWIVFDPARGDPSAGGDGTISVSTALKVSASRELLKAIAQRPDATKHLLVLGYAGWGAGQLDGELKQGAWIPVDLDERIVFETPYDERWSAALNAAGIDPMRLVPSAIAEA